MSIDISSVFYLHKSAHCCEANVRHVPLPSRLQNWASNKPLKTRVDDDFVSIFLTSDFKHDGQPVSDLLMCDMKPVIPKIKRKWKNLKEKSSLAIRKFPDQETKRTL